MMFHSRIHTFSVLLPLLLCQCLSLHGFAIGGITNQKKIHPVYQSTSSLFPTSSSLSRSQRLSPNEYTEHSIRDSFNLVVLGDLHLEDDMTCHNQARNDCITALKHLSLMPCRPSNQVHANGSSSGRIGEEKDTMTVHEMITRLESMNAGELSETQLEMMLQKKKHGELFNSHLVSLGDLGRKDIRHEPGDAGTTKSFIDAKEFLDGFHLPYDLVTGNHDLEGLDEFTTDEDNLKAWMDCFGKDTSYFSKHVGERTLLVGMSTVRFRNSPHSSHECHVDDEQLEWFEKIVEKHPDSDGWRVIVFSHAPIMGSNLRVLQNVHMVNGMLSHFYYDEDESCYDKTNDSHELMYFSLCVLGCAWMNHCSEDSRRTFIEIVQRSPQIKMWCSGHFHLSHDFEDSLSRVNQCTFMQGKKNRLTINCSRSYCVLTNNIILLCSFIWIVGVVGQKR